MNTLDIAISCGMHPRRVAATGGGEYASACPMCGGNDRFRIWPEKGETGRWFCRGCNKSGDAITLLMAAKKMTFKEACAATGKKLTAHRRTRELSLPDKTAPIFSPSPAVLPSSGWRLKAAAFVDYAFEHLLQTPAQLSWLAARGITEDSVRRFKLGWNPRALRRKKTAWGVEDNGNDLYLPAGIVIPCFSATGEVLRIRIRRHEGEPRYCIVSGGDMSPMIFKREQYPPQKREAWVMVESELDAMLIAQDAGDIISVSALGSAACKPGAEFFDELKNAAQILISLDADDAGAKAALWWKVNFPQADRWPVPQGKDPGDFKQQGGDIRAWIIAGLPYGLRSAVKRSSPSSPLPPVRSEPPLKADEGRTEPPQKMDTLYGFVFSEKICRCGKRLEMYLQSGNSGKDIVCHDCLKKEEERKNESKK